MCVCPISEPIRPRAEGRGGAAAEELDEGGRDSGPLPVPCTLSQNAFSDLPTKLEARHQYFPASLSVTLDSFNLVKDSDCLLTKVCRGKIEKHNEALKVIYLAEKNQQHITNPLMLARANSCLCAPLLTRDAAARRSHSTLFPGIKRAIQAFFF